MGFLTIFGSILFEDIFLDDVLGDVKSCWLRGLSTLSTLTDAPLIEGFFINHVISIVKESVETNTHTLERYEIKGVRGGTIQCGDSSYLCVGRRCLSMIFFGGGSV